ncbi:COX15/CtaA family protein [Salininema proteolyticum]|uniref:Heme A synthase n=1 Tax=Salininema proteolyticum TaxID=1607685 RepID=A0ABV8U024_9ACTN
MLHRWFASQKALRGWALANLIANVGIIVTGGAVRLTGSGLGCSEWPKCTEDSLVATREMGVHGAIEFGNRTLTGVLIAIAAITLVAAWLQRPRRKGLVTLSAVILAGMPFQGVIGGITVWSDLNPYVVSSHFLFSMVLVALATTLFVRAGESDGPRLALTDRWITALVRVVLGVSAAVIALGVLVTASGPHAGDENARRTGFDPAAVTQLHADGVWLLIGLVVAMMLVFKSVSAHERVKRAGWALVAVIAGQGLIGYVQYYTDLPEILVGMHMLGSALLMIAAVSLQFSVRLRETVPEPKKSEPVAAQAG